MDTGDIAYRKTLGVSDMLPPGMQDTGRPSSGGVILTASGLTFVGGTDDFRFRAFATATGDKLWEIKLPSSIETTPITYMGADGRQFVTVVSTGGGLTGSRGHQRRDHRLRVAEAMTRMDTQFMPND